MLQDNICLKNIIEEQTKTIGVLIQEKNNIKLQYENFVNMVSLMNTSNIVDNSSNIIVHTNTSNILDNTSNIIVDNTSNIVENSSNIII